MAITKVGAINTIPTTTDDWTNTVKHINGFINQVNSQAFILSDPLGTASPTIKQGCYINHGGTLYIVDTEDYTPSGSPADGNVYIKLTPSGDTLVGSFITDISSYSFSQQYGNMVSGSDMILPYLLVKSGASWTKYRYQPMSASYGAIKATSVDTGHGANELYPMNQDVRTTASPTFASVNTGQGANELYAMNQNVRTTDAVTFATVNTGNGAVELYPLIFESVSLTATSADAQVTVSPIMIGQEVLVTATLTAANNYDALIKLPTGSEKYQANGSIYLGGSVIERYSMTTQQTVTRYYLIRRLT